MKIVIASYYLPPVDRIGSGVQMHMLANEYCKLGHEVKVISPALVKDADAQYSLQSVHIGGKNRVLKWAQYLASVSFDADMVHCNGDDFLMKNHGKCVHIRTFMGSCLAEAKVANGIGNRFRMTILGLSELVSSIRFEVTTAISRDTNNYLLRKAKVIPCGVDRSVFKKGNQKSANPSILFVGVLDSRKRGRLLLDVFTNIVRTKVPNAELWVVRDDSAIAVDGVKVFGSVSQEKLVDLYQRAWVFCLPSSYEGFGVPYIEAMACGTPVVATRNPGALEVLDGGRYGLLTSVDQLGETLVSLILNQGLRDEFSSLGFQRSLDYDIHEIAKQYVQLASDFSSRSNAK